MNREGVKVLCEALAGCLTVDSVDWLLVALLQSGSIPIVGECEAYPDGVSLRIPDCSLENRYVIAAFNAQDWLVKLYRNLVSDRVDIEVYRKGAPGYPLVWSKSWDIGG